MQLKYIVLSVFISSIYWGSVQAQSIDDAVKFSKDDNPGSARIKAMGNVQTAVGGDISSINGNPAGLGFYSRSDVSATFNLLGNKNKTDYFGTKSNSNKTNFGVDQAGAVFNFPTYNNSGWHNFNMGISYNKTQNYNSNLIYDGNNNTSTIVNTLTDLMANDNTFANDFYLGSGLVEKFANTNDGFFPIASEKDTKNQYNEILTRGNKSKTALSFGTNYNDKLYLGASFGITTFNYEKRTKFIENGFTKTPDQIKVDNPNSNFANPDSADYQFANKSYELFDNFIQNTAGTGVDLKIGAIYKPTADWNLGITVTTPTWMTVQDDTRAFTDVYYYETSTSSNPFYVYEQPAYYDSSSDYNMTTPWKFSVGATKLFSRGLLSADVEYVTYNTIRYSSTNGTPVQRYKNTNESIKNNLQGVVNVRLGGEYLINNILSGRAGFNYFGNPYKYANDTNYSGSLGLGVKLTNTVYLDLAVVHQVNKYNDAPYVLSDFWINRGINQPVAKITNQRTSGILTIGAKF